MIFFMVEATKSTSSTHSVGVINKHFQKGVTIISKFEVSSYSFM